MRHPSTDINFQESKLPHPGNWGCCKEAGGRTLRGGSSPSPPEVGVGLLEILGERLVCSLFIGHLLDTRVPNLQVMTSFAPTKKQVTSLSEPGRLILESIQGP